MEDHIRQAIKEDIENLIQRGYTDKVEILTECSHNLNVAMPIVRRVARELRSEWMKKISILQGQSYNTVETRGKAE